MKVELLYFDGCPSWLEADARLREALEAVGSGDVEVERVLVSTPKEAEEVGFHGSPTVLVDGVDLFAEPGAAVGLSWLAAEQFGRSSRLAVGRCAAQRSMVRRRPIADPHMTHPFPG